MAEGISVFLIDADEMSARQTKSLLSEIAWLNVVGESTDPTQSMAAVRQVKPAVVMLNLNTAVDELLGHVEKIIQTLPGTTVFVTSSDKNPETIIKAMRSGAREFLGQPLDREEVQEAFTKVRLSDHRANEGVSGGKVISVFGVKGGVGATTIATNLAVNLTGEVKKKVILMDLNLQLGNAPLFLNMKPKYSIVDITGNIEDMDPVTIKGILPQHSSGMYLLAGPPHPEQSELVRESHLEHILTFLRSMFDYIVIDTTNILGELTLRALDESDIILAVFTDDLASVYNARQCLDIFQRMEYGEDKVRLVMNRGISNRGIPREEVEKTIKYKIFWNIPNEKYPTVLSSLNQGIPISVYKPHSKLSASFRDLTGRLDRELYPIEEDDGEGKKRGLGKRLFGKK
jgi:pilus assembly protein CpaE